MESGLILVLIMLLINNATYSLGDPCKCAGKKICCWFPLFISANARIKRFLVDRHASAYIGKYVFTVEHFYIVEKPLNPCICTDKQSKPETDLCICADCLPAHLQGSPRLTYRMSSIYSFVCRVQ